MATKNCIVCNKLMEDVRRDKKYCSTKCSRAGTTIHQSSFCNKCEKEFTPLKNGKTRRYCFECVPDIPSKGSEMRTIIKLWSLEYKGGCCELCGYDKCKDALDFHHLDESQKLFGIGDRSIPLDWQTIKIELDKCMLVCANCHREIHSK